MWQDGISKQLNEKGGMEIEERHRKFKRPRKGFADVKYVHCLGQKSKHRLLNTLQ